MAIDYSVLPLAKPEPRRKAKRRLREAHADAVAEIRVYVFGRERGLCRICRCRRADSMHELRPRSLGGKVSKANSVAVCGDGVRGCHGFAQRHEIDWSASTKRGADGTLSFKPRTQAAADQMLVALHRWIVSPPMSEMEHDA